MAFCNFLEPALDILMYWNAKMRLLRLVAAALVLVAPNILKAYSCVLCVRRVVTVYFS